MQAALSRINVDMLGLGGEGQAVYLALIGPPASSPTTHPPIRVSLPLIDLAHAAPASGAKERKQRGSGPTRRAKASNAMLRPFQTTKSNTPDQKRRPDQFAEGIGAKKTDDRALLHISPCFRDTRMVKILIRGSDSRKLKRVDCCPALRGFTSRRASHVS
jgi:hypothetical protein